MSKRRNEKDNNLDSKKPKLDNEQSLKKSQISFTLDEKKCFLKACQDNGLNVIYDIKKLKEYLPERTETEIKFLIEIYERKSKSRKEDVECRDTPLESWYNLCNNLIRPAIKKEDSSLHLIELLNEYSKKETKYSNVFKFIKELMQGRYPFKLDINSSIIFLSLINNLKYFIENQDLTKQKEYLFNQFKKLTENLNQKSQLNDDNLEHLEIVNYFEKIDSIELEKNLKLALNKLNNLDEENYDKNKLINEKVNYITASKESSDLITQQTVKQTVEQTQINSSLVNLDVNNDVHLMNDQSNEQQNFLNNDSNLRNDLNFKILDNNNLSNEINDSDINSNLINNSNEISNSTIINNKLSNQDNPFYYYSKLPRIKLIKECLNPLDISLDLLKDLHSAVILDRLNNNQDN